jgi:hypothetical protein
MGRGGRGRRTELVGVKNEAKYGVWGFGRRVTWGGCGAAVRGYSGGGALGVGGELRNEPNSRDFGLGRISYRGVQAGLVLAA